MIVTVSHYMLSIHLTTAFIIISTIFWLLMNVIKKRNKKFFKISNNDFPFISLIFLILLQIIIGAFVSGLDAGRIYQTWPLMGNSFFPNDISFENYINLIEFSNHSLVQFYHRNLAYLIIIYTVILSFFIYKKKLLSLYFATKVLLFFLFLQVFLEY